MNDHFVIFLELKLSSLTSLLITVITYSTQKLNLNHNEYPIIFVTITKLRPLAKCTLMILKNNLILVSNNLQIVDNENLSVTKGTIPSETRNFSRSKG